MGRESRPATPHNDFEAMVLSGTAKCNHTDAYSKGAKIACWVVSAVKDKPKFFGGGDFHTHVPPEPTENSVRGHPATHFLQRFTTGSFF